jgi:hypothetical protein
MRRSDKPAPTGNAVSRFGIAVALLLIWLLILILGAPLNHDGRRQVLRSGHPGMDAGVAATRPGMADRGGPTEQCLTAGMPSLGEAPSGGARALCLLWRSSKVSRRKGGTLSGRDRSNGYVHIPRKKLCDTYRHRKQAHPPKWACAKFPPRLFLNKSHPLVL